MGAVKQTRRRFRSCSPDDKHSDQTRLTGCRPSVSRR